MQYWETGVVLPHVFGVHSGDVIKKIALFAQKEGVSDIFIQADKPIVVAYQGRMRAVTRRSLDANEVWNILQLVTERQTAKTDVMSGKAVNASYIIQDEEGQGRIRQRFYYRVNATAIQLGNGNDSVQMVMRAIPSQAPHAHELDIHDDVLKHISPKTGLVCIAGATGSGKTTTFAAFIRHILENDTDIQGNIITYEAPIEFRFDGIHSQHSIITQTEIPKHLPSFYEGVKQAMRRKPELIMIGELRDEETILSAIEAALTGHAVFATVHANDVASIFTRILYRLPEGERSQAMYKLVDASRFLLAQRLIVGLDGKRLALREYLPFSPALIEELLSIEHTQKILQAIKQALHTQGQSFAQHAQQLWESQKIDAQVYLSLQKTYGYAP